MASNSNNNNNINARSSKPSALFGSEGDGAGQFHWPWGIAFDQEHKRLVVCDQRNNRIQLVDTKGTFISQFGQKGNEAGQFDLPHGVCVQPSTHHIIVADEYNHRLQVFSLEGKHAFMSASPHEDSTPFDVACNAKGQMVSTDSTHHKVHMFDADGHLLRSFGQEGHGDDQFDSPWGITTSRVDSSIIVADCDNTRVCLWSPDGAHCIKTVDTDGDPIGICTDLNNLIYVTYENAVEVIDPRVYKSVQTIGSKGHALGEFEYPTGICVDEQNALYVVDGKNHRVQRFP